MNAGTSDSGVPSGGKSFPLPPNESARLEELRRYAVLDTPPEKAFDDITELAARIFEVPMSTVTLIDEERQWFKSCFGLETREAGRNVAFCAHAILGDQVMIVPDARTDVRFADNPLVLGPPHIRFYAGAPLRTSNGLNLGTLCVIDTEPRSLTKNSAETLAGLAKLVLAEIELRYGIGEHRRAAYSLRLLEAAVHQCSDSVVITTSGLDLPGPEIVFVNPAFTRITGYAPEEVFGKTPRIFQGPKTDRSVLDGVREQLAKGEEVHFEVVNYRKDGSDFIISCQISPIRGDHGRVTNFICFQCDATERNQLATAIQHSRDEADRANRAKSEFLSRMSHELRTPLHAILGFAQLLELDKQDPDDAECIKQIVHAGGHLLGLINEVLDIARVEAGKLALTPEPVNVRQTLEEAMALIRPLAKKCEVHLEALAGTPDCEVLSSAQRFKQVILNLLSNALKFNRAGGVVTIACEKVEDCLRINVRDTGRGISEANMKRLFVPFERLNTDDTLSEGAGLGLSLSKHLVEAMGGRIGVESTLGEGSTFWVELPLIEGTSPATAGILDTPSPDRAEGNSGTNPRTILYIEDNLSNLRLVERILSRRPDVTLLSAMQGSLGLELARQHQPDLLLLDLHLPDMTGEAILQQLRGDPGTAGIPIVIVSADATNDQVERLRAAGANGYLTKPIDVRSFLSLIDSTRARLAS